MGTKKLTVISTSDSSLESIQNSAISVANQKRRQDRSNNYICDVFSVKHKTQFYAVDDDFVSIINSDGNILKSDYITSTKLGEELAKIPSSGTVTLDENKVNELIDNRIATLDLDNKFSSKANVDDVYTKSEVDNNVATKDELNTKLDSSIYTTDKATYTTKNELSALVYTKSEVDEKVATISSGGSVSLDGFVRVDDIVNLATKDEVNAKLDSFTYTTDKDTFATKTQIEGKANKDEVYSKTEIDANYTTTEQLNLALTGKADKAIVDTLATKVELGSYALKSEVPTRVTINDEQIARAVNENSKIQELSSTIANLSSNLQGATYPQLVATFNYFGYSLPTTLALYDTYTLDSVSGEDTTLTISVLEHTSGYSGLCNLAVYNDNDERLVIKSYIQYSEKVASIILAPTEADINPTISEVTQTPQDYQLGDKEVEVELNFSNVYSGTPSWYSTLSDAQYCSDGASLPVFNFTFKRFKPKRFEIKTSYTDGGYAIVKANIAITHGALYNEPIAPYNKSSDNILVVDTVNLDMNANIDDKYRELVTAWNVVPKPFIPPRLISFNEFTSSLNVSKDSPFVLTLKATKFHTDSYGVGISNVEFFINGNERLYPKYAQLMSGSNDMAEFILTKDESQKVNVMTPIPSEYDYKANNEYYVKAKRISAEYSSSYTFSEMLFYTAPGGYDNEYLTGSGLVEIEFYCDFIPSKLQFIQSPYGHGKAASYETYHNGTKLTEVAYMGGTYDYEIHDFEGIKFKIYDNL